MASWSDSTARLISSGGFSNSIINLSQTCTYNVWMMRSISHNISPQQVVRAIAQTNLCLQFPDWSCQANRMLSQKTTSTQSGIYEALMSCMVSEGGTHMCIHMWFIEYTHLSSWARPSIIFSQSERAVGSVLSCRINSIVSLSLFSNSACSITWSSYSAYNTIRCDYKCTWNLSVKSWALYRFQ